MEHKNNQFTLKDQHFHVDVRQYEHAAITKIHSHDFFEIVFVTRGFSLHRVGEDVSILLPGDIFYIPPKISHGYWKSINNKVYNCLFYPEILGEDLKELMKLPLLKEMLGNEIPFRWNKMHLKPEDWHEILNILKKLEYESQRKLSGWEISSKALLTDLLVRFSRLNDIYSKENAGLESCVISSALNIIQIVDQSLNNRMSINQLASSKGYSPEYFSRAFKKIAGVTPTAYINSKRIAAAAQELLEPDVTISMAAEKAGFEDVNYFSRLFKKETGKTPTEFRKQIIP